MVRYTAADERYGSKLSSFIAPTSVSDADPDCTGMSLTVAQNGGFCAQCFLF